MRNQLFKVKTRVRNDTKKLWVHLVNLSRAYLVRAHIENFTHYTSQQRLKQDQTLYKDNWTNSTALLLEEKTSQKQHLWRTTFLTRCYIQVNHCLNQEHVIQTQFQRFNAIHKIGQTALFIPEQYLIRNSENINMS